MRSIKAFSVLCALAAAALFFSPYGCKKVDDAVDDYFTGMFASPDGWEMEIKETGNGVYDGVITKVGTGRTASGRVAGDKVIMNASKSGDNTLSGSVRWEDLTMFDPGTITVNGSTLTITPNGRSSYSFTRKTGSTSSTGTGPTTGTSTVTPTGGDTIVNERVSAENHSKKELSFTIPSGVKSMTVMTFEKTTYDRNAGDLFVRQGSAPVINFTTNTVTETYNWTADCAGTLTGRRDEVCTFTNPKSGTWYVTVFGHESFFNNMLVVIVEK